MPDPIGSSGTPTAVTDVDNAALAHTAIFIVAFWRPEDSTPKRRKEPRHIHLSCNRQSGNSHVRAFFADHTARPNPLKSDHCLSDVPVRD